MTRAQNRVFLAIKEFIETTGYSPSYSDIGRATGLKSPASIMKHVQSLKDQGYIEHRYNKARSLAICPDKVMQGFHRCKDGHNEIFYRTEGCPLCFVISHSRLSTGPPLSTVGRVGNDRGKTGGL